MTQSPFTLELAQEIAEDFEDLIDTDFKADKSVIYIVERVVPAPFPEEDRKQFVKNYLESKDAQEAIAFYNGDEYDVLLLAYSDADDTQYICIDIRTFAEQHGIRYHFP